MAYDPILELLMSVDAAQYPGILEFLELHRNCMAHGQAVMRQDTGDGRSILNCRGCGIAHTVQHAESGRT